MVIMKPDNQMPINNRGEASQTNRNGRKKGRKLKNIIFYIIIILLIVGIFATLRLSGPREEVSFSDLIRDVNDGKVARII